MKPTFYFKYISYDGHLSRKLIKLHLSIM